MKAKEIKIMYKAWFNVETKDKWISEREPYERWLERKLYEAQSKSQESDSLPCVSESYDFINPTHYKSGTKEVWEMMVDIWGVDAYIAHCEMCAFKYRQRLGLKPNQPIERDLDKAKWYETKANELRNSC